MVQSNYDNENSNINNRHLQIVDKYTESIPAWQLFPACWMQPQALHLSNWIWGWCKQ